MKPTPKNNQQQFDSATAKKVLLADVSNILSKAKSGTPLSKHERGIIARAAEEGPVDHLPEWAETTAQAARLTGYSRATLHQWRKDGCPAFKSNSKVNLHELSQWIAATGRRPTARPPQNDLTRERARLARAQARKVELQNKLAEKILVEPAEVERILWQNWLMPLKQALDALPAEVAPRVNPQDPALAERVLVESWERIKATLLESHPKK